MKAICIGIGVKHDFVNYSGLPCMDGCNAEQHLFGKNAQMPAGHVIAVETFQ